MLMKNFFLNLVPMGLERLLQMVSVILFGKMVLDAFGVDALGNWQQALAIFNLAMTATWICGSEVIVASLVRGEREKVAGSALLIRLSAGVLSATALVLYMWSQHFGVSEAVANILYGMVLALVMREFLMIGFPYFQYGGQLYLVSVISMFAIVIKLAGVYWVGRIGRSDLIGVPYAAELIIGGVLIFFLSIKKYHLDLSFDLKIISGLLKSGVVVWAVLLLQQFWIKYDRYYLPGIMSREMYAYYGTAMQLMENFYAMALLALQIIAPKFLLGFKAHRRIGFRRLMGYLVLSSGVVALLVSIWAENLVTLLYGPKLFESAEYLRRVIWIMPFLVVDYALNMICIGAGCIRYLLVKNIIVSLIVMISIMLIFTAYGPLYLQYALMLSISIGIIMMAIRVRGEYVD